MGYDTAKPFLTNVYDNVVPGRNTPLGILSAVPSAMGLGKAPQLAVTIANRLMANQAAQVPEPVSPVSEVIPTIEFTGRPDDAPIPTIEFTPNTISPSGFTRISTEPIDSQLSDEEFGEMLDRDRQKRVNEGLIDNYLQSQADVGVFTPPMPPPDLGDTRPLPTMFGERPDVQEFGGFADPLTDKTLFDFYNERMLGLQTPKVGI